MQQRRDELNLLLHALGEVFGLLGNRLGDLQLLTPVASAFFGQGCVDVVELAEENELVEHVHLLVEAALLRQIADARERFASERLVEERDRAGVGHGDADHHADGTGLARAVGAKQPEHGSRLDADGEVFHRDLGVVDLADMMELDDGHADSRGKKHLSLAVRREAPSIQLAGALLDTVRPPQATIE